MRKPLSTWKQLQRFAGLGLLWALCFGAVAAEVAPLTIDPATTLVDLSKATYLLEDPPGMLTIDDVRKPENAGRFEHRPVKIGFSASAYWVRISLRNAGNAQSTWWLDTGNHTMPELQFFAPDAQGVYQSQHAGSSLPFAQRPLIARDFVFALVLEPDRTTDFYLRLQPYGLMPMNSTTSTIQLWRPDAYQEQSNSGRTQWYFYLGMAAALGLFNLVLYFTIRDRSYLLYVVSLVSVVWWVSSGAGGNGWSYQLFWPNSPVWEQMSWVASILASALFPMAFIWHFLDLRHRTPNLHRVAQLAGIAMTAFVVFRLVVTALQLRNASAWMQAAFVGGALTLVPLMFATFAGMGLLAWRGDRSARILVVVWAPLLVAGGITIARVLTGQFQGSDFVMWASALEITLMSLALADRYIQERKARLQAQTALVDSLHQSERELEGKVQQRTQELTAEKARTQDLLHNILPSEVADELSATGVARPARHESVTVLFTDFSGFTQVASTMPADRMVAELNEVFAAFDDICDEEGVEKIKTIGDAYMAAAGLPKPCADHAERCVRAGLRMASFVEQRNADSAFKWRLRVGIHSGPVIAGVVGKRKYAFDIWGDTVNIASRMESSGEPGKVNISAYTYDLIRKNFACEYRGRVDAKGKGEVDMYFVLGEAT